MFIREENRGDVTAISTIIDIAFTNHPHSINNESEIVNKLRTEEKLALSLVAVTTNDEVIGHIAFSKILINNCDLNWFGMAPLSVLPEFQNHGIGSQLVKEGLNHLIRAGAKGCVLLGEPEYYSRFGFKHDDKLVLPNVPQGYFLAFPFCDETPIGKVTFDKAFN